MFVPVNRSLRSRMRLVLLSLTTSMPLYCAIVATIDIRKPMNGKELFMRDVSRREAIAIAGSSVAAVSLGGCLGDTEGSSGPTVVASFFPLAEFTEQVVGDAFTVENPVPIEQHGHGWEPSTDLLPEIAEAEAFVYLDAEGFQPWAEQAARQLADEDVMLIDALGNIPLLEYDAGHHDDHDHDTNEDDETVDDGDDDELGSVAELEIIDRQSGDVVAHHHFDHWHGELPTMPPESSRSVSGRFLDGSGRQFPLDSDGPYQFRARVEGGAESVSVDPEPPDLALQTNETGRAYLVFELREEDETLWESSPIAVSVSEDAEESTESDHGLVDVKFFSDPVLAQSGVRNIRDGIISLDPENETEYESNAASFIDELETLHQEFQQTLAERTHDRIVLAGHDSFNYLGTRYGFAVHTPVGLSPDDEPSGTDIARAVEVVEEHGIEYVLYDYFDGDAYAEAIVREADSAQDTAMITAAESTTEAWVEDGHGDFIGQLREITLPTIATALGVP